MTNNGRQASRKPETPRAGEGVRGRRAEGGQTKGVRVVPLWEGLRTGVRG